MIDMLVSVDRGEVVIKIKPERCLAACFGMCLDAAQQDRRRWKREMARKARLEKRRAKLEAELKKLA
jgi:hypothetical protein